MSFGSRLRAERKAAGLSQGELAGDRCSISYISHLESGRRAPTSEIMRYLEERLNLAQGTLGTNEDLSAADQKRGQEADLLAQYCDSYDSWRAGAFGLALEQATNLAGSLHQHARQDLRWLTVKLLVDVCTDLGHYEDALNHGRELQRMARSFGSGTLAVKAGVVTARAARLANHLDIAQEAADDAVSACEAPETTTATHADALVAAISAHRGQGTGAWEHTLEGLLDQLDDSQMRGRGAWTLGTVAYQRGATEAGEHWHQIARATLSPSADFRDWARFPRASAEARLAANLTDGVEELLNEAKARITLLDAPDELATLAITEAQFFSKSRRGHEATDVLEKCLSRDDLPPAARADLLLELSRLDGPDLSASERRAHALEAARLYTVAGHVEQAQEAWEQHDAITDKQTH